jgi:hypothetical protein
MNRVLLAALLLGCAVVAQANVPPVISGTPATTIEQGARYAFVPTVVDADGPSRKFVIKNRPAWLAFSYQTGGVSGVAPAPGVWKDIQIFVDDGPNTARSLPRFTITVTKPINPPPVISGQPVTQLTVTRPWTFQPSASDPRSEPLTFTVANKPSWATFDPATGKLSGTPGAGAVGTYSNIVVAVTDGTTSVALPMFALVVQSLPVEAATLSWTPPTKNVDGTALTNLAGYRIYYGASSNTLGQVVEIRNAGVSAYIVENLTPGTWYFAVTAFNAEGKESALSNIASKTTG